MKKNIFLTFLLLFTGNLLAQNKRIIDSLKTELLHFKKDTIRVNINNELSSYLYLINTKEGIRYAEEALQLATKLKWEKGIADANNSLGVCARSESNYTEALNHFYRALKINEGLKNKSGLANTLNGLGLIAYDMDDFSKALNYFLEALEINRKIKKQTEIARSLNNIATTYAKLKLHRKGLEYYKKSLTVSQKLKDTLYIGLGLTNIGISYNELGDFPKAIEYINKSINLYNDDSRLYNSFNKFELGRSYYLMALELPIGNKKEILLKKALDLFKQSNSSFQKYNSLNDVQESYRYIYKTYKELGDHKMALHYFEKSAFLKDSIFTSKIKDKVGNLEHQKKIDLKDKQIEIQELQIKGKAQLVYLLISITVVIALLLTIFFWLFLSKRKTNLKLEEKNKEISEINSQKDKFFSIIAHDLRGPFNVFLGLTEFLVEDIDNMSQEEIQYSAVSMRDSANKLFQLLENLLEWSRMEQGLIPFRPENLPLHATVEESISILNESAHKKQIEITNTIPNDLNVFADKNIFMGVIRNLTTNAIKFTPKGGKITISTTGNNEQQTEIRISDTGIGMNTAMIANLFKLDAKTNRNGTENEPSTGLGLILCRDFIAKHGGKIGVESQEGKGSTFYFTFPNE